MLEFVKSKKLLFLLSVFFPHFTFASFEIYGNNVVNIALAGAGCAADEFRICAAVNPAFAKCDNSFTLSYRRLFGLPELQHTSLSFNRPINKFNCGSELYYFGFSQYSESALSFSAAYPVTRRLYIGGRLSLYQLRITGYGSTLIAGGGVGMQFRAFDTLFLGMAADNLSDWRISRQNDKLPFKFTFGAAYQPDANLHIFADFYQEDRFPSEIKCGLEYNLLRKIVLRMGVSPQTDIFACGMDLLFPQLKFCYAFRNHPYLGIEHTLGVSMRIPN